MELTKWNPRCNELGIYGLFDRVFEDFFAPTSRRSELLGERSWNPAVDIYDEKDHTVIRAALPGVDKKDIEISMEGRVLTLKGKRVADVESDEGNVYRKEMFSGTFQRSFSLNSGVEVDKIRAEYKNGILTLEIPRPEEAKPKMITVH